MPIVDLVPVILCGGSGTRLWPLSRPDRPKQFHALIGERSLLQETVLRVRAIAGAAPVIVTGRAHAAEVTAQLAQIDVAPDCMIVEPCARNTAAAIALAAIHLRDARAGSVMWILPSDHVIGDAAALAEAADRAAAAARAGHLATFGIRPSEPHTGYGYIRAGRPVPGLDGAAEVAAFLEKPNRVRAERLLADGDAFWNSGMFVFKPEIILEELEQHAPEVLGPVLEAWARAERHAGVVGPDHERFAAAASVAIDVAVMERTRRAAMVPLDARWSDIGSWAAIWELQDKDDDDNALSDPAFAYDAHGCFTRTTKPVALIGVEDLVVVETEAAILVCRRDRAQGVGKAAAWLPLGGNAK